MRDIDLPDPPQNPRGRHHKARLQHRAAVDEGGGIAGDEDEDFGGVGKPVIADREPGQDVGRQMVDEDQPQREPAKQIEPQFALAGHGQRNRRRGSRNRIVLHERGCVRDGRSGNLIGNRHHQVPFWAGGFSRAHAWKDNIGPQLANKIRGLWRAGAL